MSIKQFLTSAARNFLRVFAGKNLFWHLLAIALTAAIVRSGLDWKWLHATQDIYAYFFPALIIGGLLPILLPIVLWVHGATRRSAVAIRTGWLMAEAALLGSVISSLYKALTGRIQPNLQDYAVDISNGFQFGFLKHGIFWGWPSSHTTIAFSMAVALAAYFPEKRVLRYAAVAYAAYIGISVSMSIHWLSDAVAGVVIGSLIGKEVGMSFHKKLGSKVH